MKFFCIAFSWIFSLSCPLFADHFAENQDFELVKAKQESRTRIIALRHGQGVHNVSGIMTSSLSPGIHLTKTGTSQVKQTASELQGENIDYVYVSPLYRTLQTAEILTNYLNIPYGKIIVDGRLREQNFGDYEGKTWKEYESIFPPLEGLDETPPNGESGRAVFIRAKEFLAEIFHKHPNQTIMLVTHGYFCICLNIALQGIYNEPTTAGYLIFD